MAQKALHTVDTDISVPAGTPQEKIDVYKAYLRSNAYSILGAIEFKKENYAAAQEYLQKAIDAYASDPAPVDVLRLALALDKQRKISGGAQGGQPRRGNDAGQHRNWDPGAPRTRPLATTHRRRGPVPTAEPAQELTETSEST